MCGVGTLHLFPVKLSITVQYWYILWPKRIIILSPNIRKTVIGGIVDTTSMYSAVHRVYV